MRYSDVFGSCHPAVNFLYFVLVIAFSMCLTHPVCLLLSVCGAVIYHAVLLGPRSLRKSAVWMVPMAVLAAVINPAFTHQGVTILAYLPSGNPLTLESLRAEGERAVVFENVIVRSGKGHDMEVHIDTDEANAIAMRGTPMMEVLP